MNDKTIINTINKVKNYYNDKNYKLIKNTVENSLLHEGDQLLFLFVAGSFLYGTNTQNSDLDIKGIFLPSKKSLLLGEKREYYSLSTGNNNSTNGYEDIDITLWSLHKFLNYVSKKGDINALEILFALNADEFVFYKDKRLNCLYHNRFDFILNKKSVKRSAMGYADGNYKYFNHHKANTENHDTLAKKISHSYRVLSMIKELSLTGQVSFPLKNNKEIRKIKNQKVDIINKGNLIDKKIKKTKELLNQSTYLKEKSNQDKINKYILSFYW